MMRTRRNLMRTRAIIGFLVCVTAAILSGGAWALDEAILTPTNDSVKAAEDEAFNSAMSVWFKHRYADGEKLLAEFAAKHPDSRWRAEAELHQACYLTYLGKSKEAKPIFERLASEFGNTPIKANATLRLANIAERDAKTDDAIANYGKVLRMNPTWDQFKYANYHARKLMMTRGKQEARINCGPVALAACLDALGRRSEAATARSIKPSTDGTSLGVLEAQCAMYGIPARSVEMALDELPNATLPILAYVEPKHFIAVLGVKEGKVEVEDSIRGKYEMSLDDLSRVWAGKVLTFAPSEKMKPLTLVASLETTGGCCGQADEDECLGDCCECQQGCDSAGGSGGGGGCCGGGDGLRYTASAGRPTWQVNVNNLNILVKDTPVFYSPGKGPNIAFTLTYSNENSNTGIFGRGWRSPYDMKVFFLPSSYQNYPTLQVHRDNGRIETYEWQYDYRTYSYKYLPRSSTANYGYRDTIEKQQDGTVILSLRGGGKYYFMPEGGIAEGRIHYIEDAVGNRVTCSYDANGCLDYVTDANGGVTDIVTEGTGINERVTNIRIPRYVDGEWVSWADDDPAERREAVLGYTDGNLTYIRDMLEDASTLSYGALAWSASWTGSASTTLAQNVTVSPLSPGNGGSLQVASTDGFPSVGRIRVNGTEEMTYSGKTANSFTGIKRGTPANASSGASVTLIQSLTTLSSAITESTPANGGSLTVVSTDGFPTSGWVQVGYEVIGYSGKTATTLTGITRIHPTYSANVGTTVYLLDNVVETPYLRSIETPSKKTLFTYEWWTFDDYPRAGDMGGVAALHEVFECGPTEDYPEVPTIHYAWCSNAIGYQHTNVTRYPTSVRTGAWSCDDDISDPPHWTGGLTKKYGVYSAFEDAAGYVDDEIGNRIAQYGYNNTRDRTSVTDASGNTTHYYYTQDKNTYYGDGKHDMYFRHDPLGNEWAYTYYDDHSLHTESDAYGRTVKTYTYNSAGQVTQIDTPIGTQVINHYDAYGRLDYSTDARGKTTYDHYNEDGETRGLLTSVHDPEGKATLYHYDEKGRRDQITDPSGNVTRFEYDDLDRVTKTIYGSGQNDPYVETKYTCCHKVYQQDENGRRTYYVYDAKVRPYKTIASAKSTTLATSITTTVPANNGSLAVTSVADFPNSGKVVVLDEIISYTGRDTQNNLLTGITRGVDGTRIVEADSGFPVGRVDTVQATYGYHPQYLDWMVSLTDALNHTTYLPTI